MARSRRTSSGCRRSRCADGAQQRSSKVTYAGRAPRRGLAKTASPRRRTRLADPVTLRSSRSSRPSGRESVSCRSRRSSGQSCPVPRSRQREDRERLVNLAAIRKGEQVHGLSLYRTAESVPSSGAELRGPDRHVVLPLKAATTTATPVRTLRPCTDSRDVAVSSAGIRATALRCERAGRRMMFSAPVDVRVADLVRYARDLAACSGENLWQRMICRVALRCADCWSIVATTRNAQGASIGSRTRA